jgi:hypothetical protein
LLGKTRCEDSEGRIAAFVCEEWTKTGQPTVTMKPTQQGNEKRRQVTIDTYSHQRKRFVQLQNIAIDGHNTFSFNPDQDKQCRTLRTSEILSMHAKSGE